mmetsp:Transcript_17615/g.45429  ORF Transcript_17615/g.45429 Transcript_17615/m.45429 type:complete len:577 (+) Transcript_17615:3-1733(+)
MGVSSSTSRCACWPRKEQRPARGAAGGASAATSTSSSYKEGWETLAAVLAIERRCLRPESEAASAVEGVEDLNVECMMDESRSCYYLCSSLSSPTVIAYYKLHIPDVYLADVHRALVDPDERRLRDSDSEYQCLRPATEENPTEDISFVLRAPWPFSDRDVLQRRWQLSLPPTPTHRVEGMAIAMKSFDDEQIFPQRADRVRAIVHKSAYLLRPESVTGPGLEVVVCQQLDLGGLCPPWAQNFMTRFAVQRSLAWGKDLREHCLRMQCTNFSPAALAPGGGAPETPKAQDQCESIRASLEVAAETPAPVKPKPMVSGEEILSAILAIERCCRGSDSPGPGDSPVKRFPRQEKNDLGAGEDAEDDLEDAITVECLHEGPTSRYCMCGSLDTPVVIGYLRVVLDDVKPWDMWRALVQKEERLMRDPDSEFRVLRKATSGDPTHEEDIAYVWRAPWPFWDRDFLQRRWTFPLQRFQEGEGIAIVMRSLEDEGLCPVREDRVRAFVHKCGYLLRPDSGGGLDLTVCQQVDLGGLCPEWAQDFLTRYTVHRGLQWAEDLRQHCARQHNQRTGSVPKEGTAE